MIPWVDERPGLLKGIAYSWQESNVLLLLGLGCYTHRIKKIPHPASVYYVANLKSRGKARNNNMGNNIRRCNKGRGR